MKDLLLCRHAKSSWKNGLLADIDRPLNRRGKRDAPRMGRRLALRDMVPERIVCSPAKRARKTARRLCRGMEAKRSIITIDERIYDADVADLMAVIADFDDELNRVMLVGHNFELTELANCLLGADIYNVPTCGIVGCRLVADRWQEVGRAGAAMLFFDYPKKTGL
jgi:phosphohistidine phosphatase